MDCLASMATLVGSSTIADSFRSVKIQQLQQSGIKITLESSNPDMSGVWVISGKYLSLCLGHKIFNRSLTSSFTHYKNKGPSSAAR
jgi:hypothetical protein